MIVRQLRRPVVWLPVSIALLAVVVWRSRLWEAPTALPALQVAPLVAAVAINAVIVVMWGLRSHRLLATAGRPIGLLDATVLATMAFTLNAVTPGSTGEAVRAIFLRQRHGVDYAAGTAAILAERFVALFYLTGSAALLWAVRAAGLPPVTVILPWCALLPLPLVIRHRSVRVAVLARAAGRAIRRLRSERISAASRRVDDALASMLGRPGRLFFFAATSAAIFAGYAGQLSLVGAAIGARVDVLTAWACLGIAMTAGVVSLLPFGLGSTDVVLVALLSAVGVSPVESAAVAFGYRLVSTLPLGLLGVLAYWRESVALRGDRSTG